MKKILILFILFLAFFLKTDNWSVNIVKAQTDIPWPMAGANPERTSWSPTEVPLNISTLWVKPITPYVSQHVQVVGAEGMIFVSTADGLYAFNADTGADIWQYATELPLGHSPTYDSGYLYIGGLDKMIHKVSASTGQKVWTFNADGGFSTNPVVVNGNVYIGSRDGVFYAVNASSGNLVWKYQTGNQILQSAAYKREDDGISSTSQGSLYFASNDGYAYALNAQSGALIWKSAQKLPSMGQYSWWPVIYKENVIFTRTPFGSGKYAEFNNWLFCASGSTSCSITNSQVPGELGTEPGDWVAGTATMNVNINPNSRNANGRKYADLIEAFPHYRNLFFFKRTTGQEVQFDIDNDGISDGAPASFPGDNGSPSPPIVSGYDNVLYFRTLIKGFGGFGSMMLGGWKVGTPYLSLPQSHQSQQSGSMPGDEPAAYSAAGNKIFWNHCCDRFVGAVDISQPNTDFLSNVDDGNRARRYITSPGLPFYTWPTNMGMPSNYYKEAVKYFWDPREGSDPPGLAAVFWNENDKTAPSVYRGKLYVILGNAIVAIGSGGSSSNAPLLSSAPTVSKPVNQSLVTESQIRTRLNEEVTELINAGHLKPSFLDLGGVAGSNSRNIDNDINHYWHNPASLFGVLLRALPYLSTSLQTQVRNYLQSEYTNYSPATYSHIGFTTGNNRDPYPYPPAETIFRTFTVPNVTKQTGTQFNGWSFPPYNLYVLWKYAQAGYGNPSTILNEWGNKLQVPITANRSILTDGYLKAFPLIHNAYIAGYRGYVELAKMTGQNQSQYSGYQNELNRLLELKLTNLMTFPNPQEPYTCENECYFESMITHYNFAYMTPELADYLRNNANGSNPDKNIFSILSKYEQIAPYWMQAHNGETQGEFTIMPYQQTHSLFQAKAMVEKASRSELVKLLDSPTVPVGDLYYIDNLVAVLEASDTGTTPPSQTPANPGDATGDGQVDGLDYVVWLNHYGTSAAGSLNGDFDNSGNVDGIDYVIWLNNYGS